MATRCRFPFPIMPYLMTWSREIYNVSKTEGFAQGHSEIVGKMAGFALVIEAKLSICERNEVFCSHLGTLGAKYEHLGGICS